MAVKTLTPQLLRRHAITRSLFPPTSLQAAIDRLGFIQADPIRSPARAQDLILRQRAEGYRAGDLERHYESLDVEEDYLYAYGFLSRRVWQLLHPRKTTRLRALEQKVLDIVRKLGETHPKSLEAHLGKRRMVNAWGGYSKATTNALEWLHWRGLLRIARRERGIRLYQLTKLPEQASAPSDRLRSLIMVYAEIFAPSPAKSLHAVVARHRDLGNPRRMLESLISGGILQKATVDSVSYIWPADHETAVEAPGQVRFLAPFDPVVWDRRRFEHLWGWQYRFEAYTPVNRRIRGYYAMPLLWRDDFVGWANASVTGTALDLKAGFVGNPPRAREFRRALDAEVARLEQFLQIPDSRDP